VKITRVKHSLQALLDPESLAWKAATPQDFPLHATPLNGNPMIKRVSPFMEKRTDHGTVKKLQACGIHNGEILAIRLAWNSGKNDQLIDLDQFVDGVAVMFPLTPNANAFTMGAEGDPVNAWYWKANLTEIAFDVIAEGYGTSSRRGGRDSPVRAAATHRDGRWDVVLARPMNTTSGDRSGSIIGSDATVSPPGHVRLAPGNPTRLAFAVWDGGNEERAGMKSFSGNFVAVEVEE
jgi:DMSO reductase family type II enzyme heme b subunit